MDLYEKDIAVDMVTITENLQSKEKLELAGGVTYISEVELLLYLLLISQSYINIVKDKSTLRKLIRASTEIINDSYNRQDDVVSVVDSAEKKNI